MCTNAIRTSVATFCVKILPFSTIKNKCFNLSFKSCYTVGTPCSCGKMFHSVAAEESSNLRQYLTVLFLFGTSDVVDADLSSLVVGTSLTVCTGMVVLMYVKLCKQILIF